MRDIDILQVVGQAIVESLLAVDFTFQAIELRELLAEIECLLLPFLDVRLEILHLFADRLAPSVKLFDRVVPVEADQFFLLIDLVIQPDDFRMPRAQILGECVALRLE